MRKLIPIFAGLLAGTLALPATAAVPEPACGSRETIVAFLKQNYAEELHAFALAANGSLIEIYVSPNNTWTVLVTPPEGGESCVAAGGQYWHDVGRLPGQQAGHVMN